MNDGWLTEITENEGTYGWECACGVHSRRGWSSAEAAQADHGRHVAADPESHPEPTP